MYYMKKYHIIPEIEGNQSPRIVIRMNSENKLSFCLYDWNTIESEDGWSSEEIKELIFSLNIAVEKSKYINNNENTPFLFD